MESSRCSVVENDISDHSVLLMTMGDRGDKDACYYKYDRVFSDNAISEFLAEIQSVTIHSVYRYSEHDVCSATDCFLRIFKYYFERHFPIRKKASRPRPKEKRTG